MMDVNSFLSDQEAMTLDRAILVYRSADGTLATIHDIMADPQGGPPLIKAGTNLTHEDLKSLTLRLGARGRERSILPENVLVADQDMVVWWRPARRWPIFFETTMRDFDKEIDAKNVMHPALVFMSMPGRLRVYAIPSNTRPHPDTQMHRAPYFNLYASGEMCPGSIKMPERAIPDQVTMDAYEKAFFNSIFVHTNMGAGELTPYPGGHNALWKAMAKPRIKTFPAAGLLPLTLAGGESVTLERVMQNK